MLIYLIGWGKVNQFNTHTVQRPKTNPLFEETSLLIHMTHRSSNQHKINVTSYFIINSVYDANHLHHLNGNI